jgi:L-threonine kinase
MSETTVRVPGSCGELVQGMIGGKNFLITCPIDCYTDVTVELDTAEKPLFNNLYRQKACLAVHKTLQYFNQSKRNFQVNVSSMIPIGKGMASSSADIGAACLATAACLGQQLTLQEIASIALSIEPTDAIFFPGVMMFDHRFGEISEPLGQPPGIELLVFDFGGEIDTLFFNARSDLEEKNQQKEHIIREAVILIRDGIKQRDMEKIGKGATLSALANQTILPKARLEEIIHMAEQAGALGVNVAHSGTVIGVLHDPQPSLCHESLVRDLGKQFPQLQFLRKAKLIGGGLEILTGKGRNI